MEGLNKYYLERSAEAGVDEAGRGCLAGPVVAAAVILPDEFPDTQLNDSKQLSEKQRFELERIIKQKALALGVGVISNEDIDEINILKASHRAMNDAIKKLKQKPKFLLIDGNSFTPENSIEFKCFVKGDSKYESIAAASIIAKTHRDSIMKELHKEFPVYNWAKNKGYPTSEHRAAIHKYGISPYHRRSFRLLNQEKQMSFDF